MLRKCIIYNNLAVYRSKTYAFGNDSRGYPEPTYVTRSPAVVCGDDGFEPESGIEGSLFDEMRIAPLTIEPCRLPS